MIMGGYETIQEALDSAPGNRVFASMYAGEELVDCVTFDEFRQRAAVQAERFAAEGACRGDRIILIMPQGIAVMTAFMGAMKLGAIPAILAYPNFKVEPSKYRSGLIGVSRNLKTNLIGIDAGFPDEFREYVSAGEATRLIVCSDDGAAPATVRPACHPCPQDIAFIQHSAGTTGLQKGVALSHAAVLTQIGHLTLALDLREDDHIYSWLPLYHDMGLIACFILPMVRHFHVVMQSPTDWVMEPGAMLRLISAQKCTLAWTPNFALQFLARRMPQEDREDLDLSPLRMLINCSEPVRAPSIQEFETAFRPYGLRPDACQASYAMAEAVFAVTQSGGRNADSPRKIWVDRGRFYQDNVAVPAEPGSRGAFCLVSSGRTIPGAEVRIVSTTTGQPVPDGHVGEILIRSDSLFEGYFNRPDLTAKALREGYYWSGDLGFLLDGELYVTGRMKDMIIVAGKNIYPQDIEEIAFSHRAVHDGRAIAMGMYNDALGTEDIIVVAEVESEDLLPEAPDIERSIRNTIVAEMGVAVRAVFIKPPKWIVKSTAGKSARAATKDKLLQQHPELRPQAAFSA
jgi:fatty-acyl-CoA synthase